MEWKKTTNNAIVEKSNRKERWIKKAWLKVSFLLMILLCVTGCAKKKKSDRPQMNIDICNGSDGNTYKKMDGQQQYTFHVEDGSYYDVQISVTKDSGSLDVVIRKNGDEETIYTGSDLDTSEFTVHADKVGDYQVLFTADNFIGDYSCNLVSGQ